MENSLEARELGLYLFAIHKEIMLQSNQILSFLRKAWINLSEVKNIWGFFFPCATVTVVKLTKMWIFFYSFIVFLICLHTSKCLCNQVWFLFWYHFAYYVYGKNIYEVTTGTYKATTGWITPFEARLSERWHHLCYAIHSYALKHKNMFCMDLKVKRLGMSVAVVFFSPWLPIPVMNHFK